jgi:hypothetical protein
VHTFKFLDHSSLNDINKTFLLNSLDDKSAVTNWFKNLKTLAFSNLGLAHSINVNQISKNILLKQNKDLFNTNTIGCFANWHEIDSMTLNGNKLSGQKNWISNLNNADYAVFKLKKSLHTDIQTLIYLDLRSIDYQINDNGFRSIGLEAAKPLSLTTNIEIPLDWILYSENWKTPNNNWLTLLPLIKYGFLTNFLGCANGMLDVVLRQSLKQNNSLLYNINVIKDRIDLLNQVWEKEIEIALTAVDDIDSFNLWHNNRYNQYKSAIVDLCTIMLHISNSRLHDLSNPDGNRWRDAMIWISHGKPPCKNYEI